jgi:hypothetical protein
LTASWLASAPALFNLFPQGCPSDPAGEPVEFFLMLRAAKILLALTLPFRYERLLTGWETAVFSLYKNVHVCLRGVFLLPYHLY